MFNLSDRWLSQSSLTHSAFINLIQDKRDLQVPVDEEYWQAPVKVNTCALHATQHSLVCCVHRPKKVLHGSMKELRMFVPALFVGKGWNQFRHPLLGNIK